jgi:general L-amino acid transport system substrate-binding protein
MRSTTAILLLAVLFIGCIRSAKAEGTLDAVRKAGVVACGLVADEDDYSEADTHGNLTALGADYCRAMAAEILNDPGKARIFTMPDEPSALAALRTGKVDVVFGATPDPILGSIRQVAYGPPLMIDGQGVLVARRLGIRSLADLGGRDVCFINNSPAEHGLYDGLEPQLAKPEHRFPYSERGEMNIALMGGHCDAIIGDISWLANVRVSFQSRAKDFEILPETISTDPFSPAYRSGDAAWGALVDWTVWGLLQAETHGITQANVGSLGDSKDVTIRRLVGTDPWIGKALGVSDRAFAQAVAAVGNAGEIYDRDVGVRLGLPRGRSALAAKGGLSWALPVEPLQ